MKQSLFLIFLIVSIGVCGQPDERTTTWNAHLFSGLYESDYKDSLSQYDFGSLWTDTDNSLVFGFKGENYQRIRIKIISAIKNNNNPNIYAVNGKSMVKNNIYEFSGAINVKNVRVYEEMHLGIDSELVNHKMKKQGILVGEYHFEEDKSKPHSGIFNGIFYTSWYIDSTGLLNYDDIEKYSDSYMNNEFIGTWKDYKTRKSITCNWGDYRIPYSGDFDIGAGEFSPQEKYLQFGWQVVRDTWLNDSEQVKEEARKSEAKEWWK
jgi:hypothetical protein